MTDKTIQEGDFSTQLFEQLLDEYTYDLPKPGQILNGEVLRVEDNAIFADVGLKRDAVIPARDLETLDPGTRESIQVGDSIKVVVVHPGEGDQYLEVSLARGLEHESWDQATKAQQDNQTLFLEVVGQNKGGLLVQFYSLRGFVPNSKIPELVNVHDRLRVDKVKRGLIGAELPVKIIEIDPENNRLVFSAEAAIEEQRKKRLAELQVGEIVTGKVVTIVDFGAFIDLNGIDGLIHISELDWRRVNRPSDVLKLGDEVQAKVTEVDQARERVSLSRKVLLPSPWAQFAEEHKTGEVLEGQITNVLDFGAFVELPGGIQGLVPTREIGYLSAGKPQDVVTQGERVLVKVMEIEPTKERITLSMRRVPMESQITWLTDREQEAGTVVDNPEQSGDDAVDTQEEGSEISPSDSIDQPAESEQPADELESDQPDFDGSSEASEE